MKESGFTLIELLGTIIILGVLMLIVTLSVNGVINNSESKLSTIQIENIKDAAKVYYLNEGMNDEGDRTNFSHCVNVSYLIENDYIDDSEMEEENITGSVKITYNSKKYKYTYEEDTCSICTLKSGEPNTIGSKYQCKVKDEMEEGFNDGYYFYILSTNEDGTTNLIMERNMYYDEINDVGKVATETNKGLVAWISSSEYGCGSNGSYCAENDKGPITAMNYIHNATKDWNNVPNMIMDYEDENIDHDTQDKGEAGYGSIKTTGNITIITNKSGVETGRIQNLKTRLPKYSEIYGADKCLSYYNGPEENEGSCPLWLVNYTTSSLHYKVENAKIEISGIDGYWTLSSHGNNGNAWEVSNWGVLYTSANGVDDEYYYGVRPVITLKI